ncbi:hypothetical protein, partial [Paenibacillus piscarius]|uniref:hypothetical protein n=1 Tax=Paenibacillus piscarius TaxID=1089681 RepID=UPI001EE8E425
WLSPFQAGVPPAKLLNLGSVAPLCTTKVPETNHSFVLIAYLQLKTAFCGNQPSPIHLVVQNALILRCRAVPGFLTAPNTSNC